MQKLYIISLIILLLISCKKKTEATGTDLELNYGPDETVESLRMISTVCETQEWLLIASYAKKYNEKKLWIAYDVIMETLNENDKNFYSSDSAYVYDIENEVHGYSNVVVESPRGIMKTDKVIWHRYNDRIYAPNKVYLKRDNNEMWGHNIITNSNLDYIEAVNVSGKGIIDDENI
jgi:LPS export ABC transporter protein LptC